MEAACRSDTSRARVSNQLNSLPAELHLTVGFGDSARLHDMKPSWRNITIRTLTKQISRQLQCCCAMQDQLWLLASVSASCQYVQIFTSKNPSGDQTIDQTAGGNQLHHCKHEGIAYLAMLSPAEDVAHELEHPIHQQHSNTWHKHITS